MRVTGRYRPPTRAGKAGLLVKDDRPGKEILQEGRQAGAEREFLGDHRDDVQSACHGTRRKSQREVIHGLFRCAFAVCFVQQDLAQAHGVRSDFHVFVLLDVLQCLLKRELYGRNQTCLVIRTTGTHIGKLLGLRLH